MTEKDRRKQILKDLVKDGFLDESTKDNQSVKPLSKEVIEVAKNLLLEVEQNEKRIEELEIEIMLAKTGLTLVA